MNEMTSILNDVKEQSKHHVLPLFLAILAANLLPSVVRDVLASSLNTNSTPYLVLSFLVTLLSMIFANTIMFSFVKRVRKQTFIKADIKASLKMAAYHIFVGLVLSLLLMLAQMGCTLLGFFPPLYYVVFFFIQAFFLYWNAIVAFAIYDNNHSMKEYISGAFTLLVHKIKIVALVSIPYVVITYVIQLVALQLYLSIFEEYTNFNNLVYSFSMAKGQLVPLLGIYVLFYGVSFMILVPLFMVIANLYERYHEIFMPSGKGRGLSK